MPVISDKNANFFYLTLKSEKNLILTLMQSPEILNTLSFSEKMLIFTKISSKAFSLELIEAIMSDLLQENKDFIIKIEIFLENTRSLDLTLLFPVEFLRKLSSKIRTHIISEKNNDFNKKFIILDRFSHCKTLLFYKDFFDKPMIKFIEGIFNTITLDQLKILNRIFGKTSENIENKILNDFLHSKTFLLKIEALVFKQWEAYMDIIKILNNYYADFELSAAFFNSILEFLFAELDGNPRNHIFLLKNLVYFLNKYQEKIDFSDTNIKLIPKKEILLNILESDSKIIDYELILSIFSKILKNELSSIQKLLSSINSLDLEKKDIKENISMLHLISKLSCDTEIKKSKWAKDKCYLIIERILKKLEIIEPNLIETLEEKDLTFFFSSLPKIIKTKEKMKLKPILDNFFEKTLLNMRKDKFSFSVLQNILIAYSEHEIRDKFFFVILEEKLMESYDDMINSINHLDFLLIKKAFRSVGFGSRKFYNFLESVLADRSNENIKNSWKFYKKREARYIDFKEKKRKSFKYADKKKEKVEENH